MYTLDAAGKSFLPVVPTLYSVPNPGCISIVHIHIHMNMSISISPHQNQCQDPKLRTMCGGALCTQTKNCIEKSVYSKQLRVTTAVCCDDFV